MNADIQLLQTWEKYTSLLDIAKREINRLECAVLNAANAFGKALVPPDAKEGEKFCVWHDSRFFEIVVRDGGRSFAISVR